VGQDRHVRRWTRFTAAAAGAAIATAAVVGVAVPSAGAAAKPANGGDIRFGLEAETTGGWCINQAQLVSSGIQVAAAIYDTLTMPNTKKLMAIRWS